MKVLVSDIKKEKSPIILKEEIKYLPEQYSHVFSLNKIKKVEVEAKCSNFGDIVEIYFEIKADLVLQCSYTLEDVDYLMDVEETLEFSFEPINEEIIEIEGNEIDLDEYVLSIIIERTCSSRFISLPLITIISSLIGSNENSNISSASII